MTTSKISLLFAKFVAIPSNAWMNIVFKSKNSLMKYFFAVYLMLLNILPLVAAPRDDRDSGTSGITLLIVIILFIVGAIGAKEKKDR